MIRTKLGLALVALAALALAIPALSSAGRNTIELTTKLKGANEVPGPGSPEGKGEIDVFAKPVKEKLCYTLEVQGLDPVIMGHIHKGAAGVSGPIKITLFHDEAGLDGNGSYEGCVKEIKEKLLNRIVAKPEKFYVNIHTGDYPDGAIRGQLALTEGAG